MSVPNQMPIVTYTANGITNKFIITFDLHDPAYLVVTVNKEKAAPESYSVDRGEVVFRTPPNNGDEVTLARDTVPDRETNFSSYDNSMRPEVFNHDFDKLWHFLQEQNLVDAVSLARIKDEIEWRRTHDFNYDMLAQMREKQIFAGLKQYVDTFIAATNPNIFGGVTAGVVFALDQKSVQTHLDEIADQLEQSREDISDRPSFTDLDNSLKDKATFKYVDDQVGAIENGLVASFTTYALADAAKSTLPQNSSIQVTNDPDENKNGLYNWDGFVLKKSSFDPVQQANSFTKKEVLPMPYSSIQAFSLSGVVSLPAIPDSQTKPENISNEIDIINDGNKVGFFKKDTLYANLADLAGNKLEPNNMHILGLPAIPETASGYEFYAHDGTLLMRLGAENKDDNFLLGIDFDKSESPAVINSSPAKFPTFYSDQNATYFVDQSSIKVLDQPSYSHISISENACVAAVDSKNWGVGIKQMAINKDGLVYPNPERTLVIIFSYGQSLSVGAMGKPIFTTVDKNPLPKNILKFKDYSMIFNRTGGGGVIEIITDQEIKDFDALHASELSDKSTAGETFCEQMLIQLAEKIDKTGGVRLLGFSSGCGGTNIDGLSFGSDSYITTINAVKAATRIAKNKGWNVVVPAFCWQQGESSIGDLEYETKLLKLISDFNKDIKAITNQDIDIRCYAANTALSWGATQSEPTKAIYKISKEKPEILTQVGGAYECQMSSDNVHLTTRGYTLLGHKYADAIYHELKNGWGTYKAVRPKKITRTDNIIDIEFYVPVAPLQFKTNDVIVQKLNQGFTYVDSTNSASITKVEILSDGVTVRITLDKTPTGANKKIRAGWNGNTDQSNDFRQGSNLCDSNNAKTAMGDMQNHFCLTFEESIN